MSSRHSCHVGHSPSLEVEPSESGILGRAMVEVLGNDPRAVADDSQWCEAVCLSTSQPT